ncbi:putative acetyl-coenzyme A synthetase [Janibacter sp. HTCC2649]|uniref:AMP-binding protein n=1 Tax=Janibacter sp. HTCC2649 TaxID=313589 RepID=UPI0000671980|nr:AMP-binding protein [Janibacter sp. HTCC2649]EAP98256.1 putative acetyl-coenzyme A synthetase [Janibacter sp. HTCC2649]
MTTTSTTASEATQRYRAARDQILGWRGKHEEAVREFTFPDLGERFNWGIDWFDVIARDNSTNALVVIEEDGSSREITFDAMANRSDRVGRWLVDRGVAQGDPVIIMLDNQVELWDCMLAVMKLGAIIMPTTSAAGAADLEDRVARGGAKHVITNASQVDKLAGLPGDITRISVGAVDGWHDLHDAYAVDSPPLPHPGTAPGDPLLLYFTSGTTSKPKLVEHTQVSYPLGHLSTVFWLGLRPGDVHLNISSPGWAKHAWSCFFAPWIAEATILVYNYARFDAPKLLEVLRDNEVTTFCAPPTVWRMLINADLSDGPGSLREVIGAGEPLNPEVISQVQDKWGLALRDGYGQTEMTAAVGNTPGSPLKPGSMGRPLPGCPVVLVDPATGARVEGVGEGELCLDLAASPLPLMTGYQGDPERNAEAMADGFYHTGDVASVDEDGYITYVGRTDDVFKASDYKISPFELESVLIEHPAVAEAAIVPAPDEVRLAVPKAYVVLAPGHEPTEETARSILAYAREHLQPWQRVRRLEFGELPKTISGKIRRVELRGREEQVASGEVEPPENEYRDDILKGD